jgi:2Fe-2S ferredoxin
MPKVIYITPTGERREVEVENGYSVMEGAINNNVEGIMEDSMLDAAYDRRDNSRLTCQLEMNDGWDGLIVHVGENEY